ncbi:MAG: serine protease [Planctomycetota bacterium]|nr:MAG: serine protease [Planctomycetota bacterium]
MMALKAIGKGPTWPPSFPTDFPLGRVSMTLLKRFSTLQWLAIGVALQSLAATNLPATEPSPNRITRTVQAIRNAQPAVVNIEGTKPANPTSNYREAQQVNGMGAGVIVHPEGYILTNQHVVQDVGRIEVTLHNGRQLRARLLARDAGTDLALIKVESRPLPVIPLGTSSDLMLGEPVIAIGNPFGYRHTVTEGIISALHRNIPVNGVQEYPDLIQTDASINPGNSGGPLLNADGLMIGLNAAVRIGAQGIGFAIPVDKALDVTAQMVRNLRDTRQDRLSATTVYQQGDAHVQVTSSRMPQVKVGDKIVRLDGHPLQHHLQLELALLESGDSEALELEILRDQETVAIRLPVGTQSKSQIRLTSTSTPAERVSQVLGMRLQPIDPAMVRSVDDSYKGGMRVLSVSRGGPADRAQIRPGDILVGLLEWQTPNWDDLEWILDSDELSEAGSAKFHIIRGKDVFWGTLDL